tara:strand:- start:154 stop:765 length:612 start_codon:yes stop_codon:yes gene_type:complete
MQNFKYLLNDDELLGEFLGLFAGDGCINKTKHYEYRIYLYFNITEINYVIELKKILFKLFKRYPMEFRRKNIIILAIYSKFIFELVFQYLTWNPKGRKCHSVRLKHHNHSLKFKIGFLRGCLDSDGYLSDKTISFASSSKRLARDMTTFLDDLGIIYRFSTYKEKRANRVDMHHIYIRKKERRLFLQIIKPRERKNLNALAGI